MKTTHLKKIFAFLCASILSLSSYAQDKNQLYADAVSVKAGQEVVVPIYLRNDVPICNFEFYLSLPKGVSIKKIGDEIFASEKGERATETHSVACTRMEDGTYYLFEYSSDNKCFPDTEEAKKMPVMYITLGIDQKTPVGDPTGMIKNQLLNHDNGTLSPDEYKPSDVSFVIHVMNSSNFIAVDNVDNEIIKTIKAGDRVELTDGGYKSVSITANINNVNISYSRTYKNTSWQAWYVPFGFTLTSEIADRFSFAKFAGTYTEAGQFFITLVEMQEGETIKANTPYFVQAKTADSTNPQVLNISNTTLHATDASGLKMLSAEKEIAIYGTYAKKVAAANDDWYAYGGGSYIKAKEGQNLGAFRFYLTILDRRDNVYSWTDDVDDIKVSITGTPNFIVIDGSDKKSQKEICSEDYVLINDTYKDIDITENIDNVNVSYSRTYKNTSWQAWYVPFGFTLTSEIADRFSFAKFAGTYTEAGQFFITLVEMQEGETIKANTPYFVQAKTADSTNPQVLNISNTTLHATDASGLKMLSAEKEIAIFGTYAKKVAAANDDWYAYGGGSYIKAKEGQNLGAFRFYLTIRERDDNPYQSSQNYAEVKVIVLDNEADGISSIESDVNVNSNIMFNLAGQPVGSDYKGVVIRNGKKTFIH